MLIIGTFFVGTIPYQNAFIINILLCLRMSANAYTYQLVRTSLRSWYMGVGVVILHLFELGLAIK